MPNGPGSSASSGCCAAAAVKHDLSHGKQPGAIQRAAKKSSQTHVSFWPAVLKRSCGRRSDILAQDGPEQRAGWCTTWLRCSSRCLCKCSACTAATASHASLQRNSGVLVVWAIHAWLCWWGVETAYMRMWAAADAGMALASWSARENAATNQEVTTFRAPNPTNNTVKSAN